MKRNDKKKVAILGGTGHIGKALLYWLSQKEGFNFYLFTRSIDKAKKELIKFSLRKGIEIKEYEYFHDGKFDAIINCIGIGDPAKLKSSKSEIFYLTEYYDNLILDYLHKFPECLYINFSSGAVYGKDFLYPANEQGILPIKINYIEESDYYGIAKIYSEIKHRAFSEMNIIDLRIFGFFSRFIDLEAKFFMTDVLRSLIRKEVFITNEENIIRDYINPKDLADLIILCLEKRKLNAAFDVYSKKPISKFEILENFKKVYGLRYKIDSNFYYNPATGRKINYYSINFKAKSIGYIPSYSSLETLIEETEYFIKKDNK